MPSQGQLSRAEHLTDSRRGHSSGGRADPVKRVAARMMTFRGVDEVVLIA
jgi:hypothetical protein